MKSIIYLANALFYNNNNDDIILVLFSYNINYLFFGNGSIYLFIPLDMIKSSIWKHSIPMFIFSLFSLK
jgi:hypothetical protein